VRRHRKSAAAIAALLGFSLIAAACGDDDDAGGGATTTPSDGATTPPAPDTTGATDTTGGTDTTGATDTTGGTGTTVAPDPNFEPLVHTAPDCSYAEDLGGQGFKEIRALDELTVEFELCRPDVAFEGKIAFSAFGIHPQEVLEQTEGGGAALFENPIGTGPYQLEQWDRGNQIVMTRNDEYWGEPAFAETLVFRWSEEAAQRLVELQAGSVDGIDNPGKDDFEVIANDANLQLQEREGANVFYLGMNNSFEPFDNEQVRQAMAIGIDRQRIVDNFYPQGSAVADQFLPPPIFGFTPEPTWPEYDPAAARQLLADAGFPDGFDVTLNYRDVVRGYLPEPSVVATDIQAQLADIGVTATVEPMESTAFIDASNSGELAFYLLGWGADYPDATNFLDFHFGPGATDQFGEGFPDIHDLLGEAGQINDEQQRLDLYQQVAELLQQHVPMVPVAHGGSGTAFRADVEGAHASPLSNENFSVMDPGGRDQFVWMQNAEPGGLYCADETDGESLRACEQINEALLSYEIGGTAVQPALAETWESNEDGTVWTFHLRPGVTFHDGSTFDANDVVTTFEAQWDFDSGMHTGRTGDFYYFNADFGAFLNAPPATEE
jgi:peptide/nickel transport system substrate-binding protein